MPWNAPWNVPWTTAETFAPRNDSQNLQQMFVLGFPRNAVGIYPDVSIRWTWVFLENVTQFFPRHVPLIGPRTRPVLTVPQSFPESALSITLVMEPQAYSIAAGVFPHIDMGSIIINSGSVP